MLFATISLKLKVTILGRKGVIRAYGQKTTQPKKHRHLHRTVVSRRVLMTDAENLIPHQILWIVPSSVPSSLADGDRNIRMVMGTGIGTEKGWGSLFRVLRTNTRESPCQSLILGTKLNTNQVCVP